MNTSLTVGGAVVGSVLDTARKQRINVVDALAGVKLCFVADHSFSMAGEDAEIEGRPASRHSAAQWHLERLSRENQGLTALIAFDDMPEWCYDGQLPYPRGGTNVGRALEEALEYDGLFDFCVISDGQPSDGDAGIEVAKKFKGSKIHVVFCGPKSDKDAQRWLERLAKAGRGSYSATGKPAQIGESIKQVLLLTTSR